MPCFNPTRVLTRNGHIDWSADWRYPHGNVKRLNLPCGHCLGCRQSNARDWSIRSYHEAMGHTSTWRDPDTKIEGTVLNASVITLTYDDEHLPDSSYLHHNDFQRFMKRLRIHRERHSPTSQPVRYFMCGEYGGKTGRPHYHAIVFGESFDDRYKSVDLNGKTIEMSYLLDHLWSQPPHPKSPPTHIGRCTVDSFHYSAAAYVAGYIAKKLLAPNQTGPITHTVDTSTGQTTTRHPAPEYRRMSRGTKTTRGLGFKWIMDPANMTRTYELDAVEINQYKFHPPAYYDGLHRKERPTAHAELLERRAQAGHDSALKWTPERCEAANIIALSDLAGRQDTL